MVKLSEEAVAVLERSEIYGNTLRLPGEKLARPLYEEVNKALERIGGKWNRKIGGHVFATDPADAVRTVAGAGFMPKKERDALAFFATPPAVCRVLMEMAEPQISASRPLVLEPSAGTGAIADAVRATSPGAVIHTVEIDPARAAGLSARGYAPVVGDFLTSACPLVYDVIAMNPPFTAPGDPLAYITHIRHAWTLLAEGGVLVAVAPSGFTTRGDARCTEFRAFVEDFGEWEPLPSGAFKESGTGVNCVVIRLEK